VAASCTLQLVLISTLMTVFTVRVGEHNFNVIIIDLLHVLGLFANTKLG